MTRKTLPDLSHYDPYHFEEWEAESLKEDKLKADTLTELYIRATEAEKKAEKQKVIDAMAEAIRAKNDKEWQRAGGYDDDWDDWETHGKKAPWTGGNPFESKTPWHEKQPAVPLNPPKPKDHEAIRDFLERDRDSEKVMITVTELEGLRTSLGNCAAQIIALGKEIAILKAERSSIAAERDALIETGHALTKELDAIKNPPKIVLEPDETGRIDKSKRFKTIGA